MLWIIRSAAMDVPHKLTFFLQDPEIFPLYIAILLVFTIFFSFLAVRFFKIHD